MPRHSWRLVALGYLAVVVYLTLLPFEFSSTSSLSDAWAQYLDMRFEAGARASRQQRVANLLMFLPLGFLFSGWWLYRLQRIEARLAGVLLVSAVCLAVTASVEFLQIWIPNRTPSLTDMSANVIGGLAGALLWQLTRVPVIRATVRHFLFRRSGVVTWLAIYLAAYVFISWLPLDLMVSKQELSDKLASDQWGWLMAPDGCWQGLRCVTLRGLEIALALPLGLWVACHFKLDLWRRLLFAMGAGLLLGLVVESGQLLTVSGIAEGASVWLRALGAGLGAGVWLYRDRFAARYWLLHLHALLLLVLPLYLLMVGSLVLIDAQGLAPRDAIVSQLGSLRWMPFYYYYFVPEATAIQSVFLHLGMYSFIGLGGWLWDWRTRAGPQARRSVRFVGIAAGVALLLEASKLLLAGLRPDTSAPLLAGLSAGGVYLALWWWFIPGASSHSLATGVNNAAQPGCATEQDSNLNADRVPQAESGSPVSSQTRWPWLIPVALLCLLALSWPVAGGWLALGLVACSVGLWYRPDGWALLIPALLPVLFLAPWSGRYFFDEFDLLLAVTVLVLMSHPFRVEHRTVLPGRFVWFIGLFGFSAIVSLVLSLWPLPPLTVNTFIDYMSPWNGVRVIKGFVWAVILYNLLPSSGMPLTELLRRRFVPGMVLGLAGLVLVLLWERATYPGLFNFQSSYRVTGLFADMHVGGPSIETYLLMGLPFVLVWARVRRRVGVWLLAFGLFGAGVYGLIMTYSRAGYVGFAVAGLVLIVGMLIPASRARGIARWLWGLGVALPLLLVAGLWTQTGGGFAEQRLKLVDRDLEIRQDLWRQGLALREPGILARLLGHGPGSFPGMFQAHNPEGRVPVNLAFLESSQGEGFLRLGKGDSLYLNQRVDLAQHTDYRLHIRARGQGNARLGLFVCEKHIKHSFQCQRTVLPVDGDGMSWQSLEWQFNSGELGLGPWFARRGTVLSIANLGDNSLVDIGSLTLRDAGERDLLRNGDFSRGADHWYFTSDALDTYRLENQWLEVLFDQGWLGLLAFVLLTVYAWFYLAVRVVNNDLLALGALASITGVLVVGLFSTVFWSPRLSMLFFLILLLFLARSPASTPPRTNAFVRDPASGAESLAQQELQSGKASQK